MSSRRLLLSLAAGTAGAAAVVAWALRDAHIGPALIRWAFTRGGARTAEELRRFVPDGVEGRRGLRYGPAPAEVLDVWYSAGTSRPLPTVLWVHGGGWVAGSRAEVEPYAQILAGQGHTVVAVDYSLAPAARYPTPLRQVDAALRWVADHAAGLHADTSRLVLAGDSAGAQIVAQLALAITDESYAEDLGLSPALSPGHLRGVISHCGPQLPSLLVEASGPQGWFVRTVGRAYFDTEDFDAPHVRQASVADHVTAGYPPALVTGGNADPLTPQGRAFAERLAAAGVEVTALFWRAGHQPPLGHEFQFDLDLEAARQVLDATREFLARVTA